LSISLRHHFHPIHGLQQVFENVLGATVTIGKAAPITQTKTEQKWLNLEFLFALSFSILIVATIWDYIMDGFPLARSPHIGVAAAELFLYRGLDGLALRRKGSNPWRWDTFL
jgi:hypothetical protein